MLMLFLIACAVVWLLILAHHLNRRGFVILLIWLLIGPVAANMVAGDSNPLFRTMTAEEDIWEIQDKIMKPSGRGILEPTRVLLLLFLGLYLINTALKFKRVPLDWTEVWMVMFVLVLAASIYLNTPDRVLMALRMRGEAFILPFIAYYLTRRLVTNEQRFYQLTQALIIASSLIVLICLLERAMHTDIRYRLGGPFHANSAVLVTLGLGFVIVLSNFFQKSAFLYEPRPLIRHMERLVLYLTPVIIFLTWARAIWLAFLLGVAVFLFLAGRLANRRKNVYMLGVVSILIVAITIGVLGTGLLKDNIAQRVSNVGNFYTRVGAWIVLIDQARDNLMLGRGLRSAHAFLRDTRIEFRGILSENNPHNSFLTILVEMGLLGLLAYLALVGSITHMGLKLYQRGTYRHDKWRGLAVIAIMVIYLVPALFMNSLHLPKLHQVYVYVFFAAVAGLYGPRLSQAPLLSQPAPRGHTSMAHMTRIY